MKQLYRTMMVGVGLLGLASLTHGDQPANQLPDLSEYRTVETAIKAKLEAIKLPDDTPTKQTPYLGLNLERDASGRWVIAQVDPRSPVGKAGLKVGDIVTAIDGQPLASTEKLRELILSKSPGDGVGVQYERAGQVDELRVTLAPLSSPLSATGKGGRAILGIQSSPFKDGEGAKIEAVTPGSAAQAAGLKVGDVIVAIDQTKITSPEEVAAALSGRKVGEQVTISFRRNDQEQTVTAQLRAEPAGLPAGPMGGGNPWNTRGPRVFSKPVYKLAVLPIAYPDVKLNPKITAEEWEKALFSTKTYVTENATGQPVYGSMNDYYIAQSFGKLRVEGKVFAPIEVSKKRGDYANLPNKNALLTEVLDKLFERDGADALKDYDGIFYLYAGSRFQTQRGGLYWPHKATVAHKGKVYNYFICPEGGERMANISVISHEFGHMLGLPDLYAAPERPGMEGAGVWCTMSTGHGQRGAPLHFSSWSKERMGWITPTTIDPTVKQKLILAPVDVGPNECFKVIVRPDGSEYLLLENRIARGWDKDLPGQGLLIWRVVDGRPILEESHGVLGPQGPQLHLPSVPYPSSSNNAFTPYTTPSSRSVRGGGLPVHITNINRLPDGRITFHIGYEYF
jgi:M6 family metalloprotease-like protein